MGVVRAIEILSSADVLGLPESVIVLAAFAGQGKFATVGTGHLRPSLQRRHSMMRSYLTNCSSAKNPMSQKRPRMWHGVVETVARQRNPHHDSPRQHPRFR